MSEQAPTWRVTIFDEPNRTVMHTSVGMRFSGRDGGMPVEKRLQYFLGFRRPDPTTLLLKARPDYRGGDFRIGFSSEEDCDSFLASIPPETKALWVPLDEPRASDPRAVYKVLVQTSASFGTASWYLQPRFEDGRLEVAARGGERALVFHRRSAGLLTLDEENILQVRKVKRGLNTVVDVDVRNSSGGVTTVCFVGPRGRMKTVFATLGHPI